MHQRYGWLMALTVLALLVAACGPVMSTPTPSEQGAVTPERSPTGTEAALTPTPRPEATESAQGSATASELPVDADDWHVLGSPEAPVTMVEYSDFQ